MYNQVTKRGVEVKNETVINITEDLTVTTSNGTYQAKSIILATGAQNRKLNLPNEVEFIGKGVSYCATCDGNFFKNKDVAVIGGGDTALDDAMYLSQIVNKVYLVHRRNEFRGNKNTVKKLEKKDNVEFILDANLKRINGEDKIESIDVEFKDNSVDNLKIDGLFIAIGQVPNTGMFENVLDLDEYGYIKSLDTSTSIPGVYVAGDVRTKDVRQLTTAANDGTIAATRAIEYLQ
jgi:thioredoxin reductase (NADPH)